MKIKITTKVVGNYIEVFNKFDLELFKALTPKFPKIEIIEFTGSEIGDKVHIKFLSPIKAEWLSVITERKVNEGNAYFVDEGEKLPPGLSTWRHKHLVEYIDTKNCYITDYICFNGINKLFTILLYPIIYFGFYQRKSIYKKYFMNLNNYR